MCSIMGFTTGVLTPEEFQPFFDRTVSRGPDISRIEPAGNGWLCLHRLAIMGLHPEGMQPFHLNGDMCVCNGELYLFRPLKKDLEDEGYVFQSESDCEIILPLYRKYGLDMKLNIEANHGTLAGHTFQHELRVARTEGYFGSVDANIGDMLLGWDTDEFPYNVYDTTLAMYEVLKAGGFEKGGLNFDSKTRRPSCSLDDIFNAHIMGMDTFALGLRMADKLIKDGRIDKFVEDRYSSYNSGIGKKIVDGTATVQELEEYALAMGDVKTNTSGRQEYLEAIMNQVMFG